MTTPPDGLQAYKHIPGTPLDDLPADLELTTIHAAPYCGVRSSTLDKWRRHSRGPNYRTYGDSLKPRIRYRVADIRAWRVQYYGQPVTTATSGGLGEGTPARVA